MSDMLKLASINRNVTGEVVGSKNCMDVNVANTVPVPVSVASFNSSFVLDGVDTEVERDTVTPANSNPMPVIILDDNGVPVTGATEATLQDVLTAVEAVQVSVEIIDNAISGSEMQVDVVTMPSVDVATLPAVDVATLPGTVEADIAASAASLAILDNAISGSEMQVDIVTMPAVTLTRLTVVDFLDTAPVFDAASTTINGSAGAFVQVVASLAARTSKIRVADTTGFFIGLYTGAAASEVLAFVINPGMSNDCELNISAGTRISIRAMAAASITSGELCVQFLG